MTCGQGVISQRFASLIREFDTVKNTVSRFGLVLEEDSNRCGPSFYAQRPPFWLVALALARRALSASIVTNVHLPILIVEHNLDLVLALSDRVYALENGSVFHEGKAEALLHDLDYRKEILWL